MYDILIENGNLIDGTGSPAMKAQLAVKDGKFVKIARHIDGDAKKVIDAAGKVVTPGFIDSHSHSDNQFSTNPVQTEKIEQGITTSVAGQCGGKEATLKRMDNPETVAEWKKIFYSKYSDTQWIMATRCPGCPFLLVLFSWIRGSDSRHPLQHMRQ